MPLTEITNEFGFQMHPIAVRGREIAKNYSLPTDREATSTEIINCTNSFLELYAIDEGSNRALTLSVPLAGRDQYSQEIFQAIVEGTNHRYGDFGPDQTTAFIEDDVDPMVMVRRMLTAPIPYYERINGLRAQVDVLRTMEERIFGSGGRAQEMCDIYNKHCDNEESVTPKVKPYRPELGDPFSVWDYAITDREAWALNPDAQPQSMTTLALDGRVNPDLRDSLLAIQAFLVEGKGRRIAISMSRDKTVEVCCRAYTCSLVVNPELSLLKQQSNIAVSLREDNVGRLQIVFGEGICTNCNETKTEDHQCTKKQEDKRES